MKRNTLKTLLLVFTALLAAELIFLGVMMRRESTQDPQLSQTDPIHTTQGTEAEKTEPTETTQSTEPTETEPGTDPTETQPEETEPQSSFVLTFVGDCTLGSDPSHYGAQHSFIATIGEDYDYPFRNVVQYFENDDLTFANLESVLADSGAAADKLFAFRGPTAYTQILTGSSVEAVTLANNHTMDYGQQGYDTTKQVLKEAGVAYVEKNGSAVITTEGGLVIGMYAAAFERDDADMRNEIAALRNKGAELIVAAIHWGNEGQYRPTAEQQNWAHALIDAGVDIVWGHHPHVLQKIEEYNGGVIYYSLGNFSFGGNNFPKDLDSAILQQEVIRQEDGTVVLGKLTRIPISVTSMQVQNNFQPTLLVEGTAAYDRVLSKLDGSFTGPDLVVNYNPTEPTDPEETDPTDPSDPGTSEPTTPGGDGGDGGDSGGDSGGGTDTGSGGTGEGGGETPAPNPSPDPGTGDEG